MNFSAFKEMLAEIGDYLYRRYIYVDLTPYENFSPKDSIFSGTDMILKGVPTVVIALTIGLMIASIFIYREKRQTSKLVRALLNHKCIDEESAKNAEELGVKINGSIIRRMKRATPLSKLVYYKGQTVPVSATTFPQDETEDRKTRRKNKKLKRKERKEEDVTCRADLEMSFSDTDISETAEKAEEPMTEERYKEWVAAMKARRQVDFKSTPLYIPQKLTYRADVRFGTPNQPRYLILSLVLIPIVGFCVLSFYPTLLLLADAFITLLN